VFSESSAALAASTAIMYMSEVPIQPEVAVIANDGNLALVMRQIANVEQLMAEIAAEQDAEQRQRRTKTDAAGRMAQLRQLAEMLASSSKASAAISDIMPRDPRTVPTPAQQTPPKPRGSPPSSSLSHPRPTLATPLSATASVTVTMTPTGSRSRKTRPTS
jgi:hypothetical protein